jgi:putative flippase GtrA
VHADGGRTAYVVINLVTMAFPVACLWISRHALGLADPISDNVSANVIGLALGTASRFYLYRTWVFRHPDTPGLPATLVSAPAARPTQEQVPTASQEQ